MIEAPQGFDRFVWTDLINMIEPEPEPRSAKKYRPETLVHRAADLHAPKIEVAVRYAFAVGRKMIDLVALREALAEMRTAGRNQSRVPAGSPEGGQFASVTRAGNWTPDPKKDVVRLTFDFQSQVDQYPEKGKPGVSYFKGVIEEERTVVLASGRRVKEPGKHVDALLWRDEQGKVRGILNHFPMDFPGFEQQGNFNTMVDPAFQRQGIARQLFVEADRRWKLDLKQQTYTKEGRQFIQSLLKKPRAAGGPGSGRYPKGSGGGRNQYGLLPNTGQRVEVGRGSPSGEKPYDGNRARDDNYTLPEITHKQIRDNGAWGHSHSNSQSITGAAAVQMQIPGYRFTQEDNDYPNSPPKTANKFLTEIANDVSGSEEVLHHSFENVRQTDFKVGDTLRMPLMAAAGEAGGYGIRLDADSQRGQPVVFEFEKGTQMMAYGKWKPADAKEFGYVYSEAIVAGGFKVVSVKEAYMGSQHYNEFHAMPENKGKSINIYGKVVRLKQTETFDPKKGWSARG